MRYLVIIEESDTGYAAYAPDLDGCVAAGKTIDETETLMREAIEMHLGGLQESGEELPQPHAHATYVDVRDSRTRRSPG